MAGPGGLLCVVLALVFGLASGKALLNLINSPDRHIASGKPFLVICHSEIEQPIVGCQFRVWHVLQKSEGELLDGTNPQSVVTKSVRGILQPSDVNFIWTLRGVPLGKKPASVSAAWSWPWQETNFTQSFTWTLASKHNGTNLTCQVYTQDVDSNTISIHLILQLQEGTPPVHPSEAGKPSEGAGRGHESEDRDLEGTIQKLVIGVAVLMSLFIIIAVVSVASAFKRSGCCKGSTGSVRPGDHPVKYQSEALGNSMAASPGPINVAKKPGPVYLVLLEDSGCSNQESGYLTPRLIAKHPTSHPRNLEDAAYDDVNCAGLVPEPEYEEINQDLIDSDKAVTVNPGLLAFKYSRMPTLKMEPAAYVDVNCTDPEPEPVYEEINPGI